MNVWRERRFWWWRSDDGFVHGPCEEEIEAQDAAYWDSRRTPKGPPPEGGSIYREDRREFMDRIAEEDAYGPAWDGTWASRWTP